MDFNQSFESLSVADVPILLKSSFVLGSKTIDKSQISMSDAVKNLKGILRTHAVVLCSARLKFINWCASTFVALCLGELRGVGNCAIVVGERGIGKSFLLKKIAAATVNLVPSTIVCYIQYKVVASLTPLAVLVDLMKVTYGADWSGIKSVEELQVHLARRELNVIFFIDELDAVFAGNYDECAPIITQLLNISEMASNPRRIIVVATGSSVCLRRLCFGTASSDDRSKYPTYRGKSFNDRKYTCYTLGALLNAAELHDAKLILMGEGIVTASCTEGGDILMASCTGDEDGDSEDDGECHIGSTDEKLDYSYCMDELSLTRGVIQCVVDISNTKSYSDHRQIVGFMEKRNDPILQKLWRALLEVLRDKFGTELQDAIKNDRQWAALPSATFASIREVDSSITLPELYEWIDKGFIGLADVHVDSYISEHHLVSFAHGVDLMWAVTKLSGSKERISFGKPRSCALTSVEQSCLLNPAGVDFHEELIAEALASKYEIVIPDLVDPLRFEYEYGLRPWSAIAESWGGELFKVEPDIGADLVAVHDVTLKGARALILSLFQCKMTLNEESYLRIKKQKYSSPPNVEDIIAGFQRTICKIQSTILIDNALDGRELFIKRFVVTPLRASKVVKAALAKNNIEVIDRPTLLQLWPNRVTQFIIGGGKDTEKLMFLVKTPQKNHKINHSTPVMN